MVWCALVPPGSGARVVITLTEADQSLIDIVPDQLIPVPSGVPVAVGWIWNDVVFAAPPPDFNAIRASKLGLLLMGYNAAMTGKVTGGKNYPSDAESVGLLGSVILARKKKLADAEEEIDQTERWPILDRTGAELTIAQSEELLVVLVNHRQACADMYLDRVADLEEAYGELDDAAMLAVPTTGWPT